MFQLFAVAAVVMGLSHTIAKERLAAPLRDRLGGDDTWLGYLVTCPYCVSHWLAFVLVPVCGLYVIEVPHAWGFAGRVASWFLSAILVTVIAAFLRVGFYAVDEMDALLRRRKRALDLEAEARQPAEARGDEKPLH